MRSHRRPTHLRRHHPRDRHRLLPSGPSYKAADNLTPVGRGSGVDANQHPRHRHVPGGVRTRQQAVSDETSAATGPMSDRYGRRIPLLVGITAYIIASVLCAISPSIETLVFARLVQGVAGAVGIVISQAAGRDVYEGGALIRYYGRLTVLGGLAAVIGPVVGGQLARTTDWRGG